MRISDWSSDVCSSDLVERVGVEQMPAAHHQRQRPRVADVGNRIAVKDDQVGIFSRLQRPHVVERSEEHTSELQSLMRISYAVFCLKKKNNTNHTQLNISNKPIY